MCVGMAQRIIGSLLAAYRKLIARMQVSRTLHCVAFDLPPLMILKMLFICFLCHAVRLTQIPCDTQFEIYRFHVLRKFDFLFSSGHNH